jgi:hypothetical protein
MRLISAPSKLRTMLDAAWHSVRARRAMASKTSWDSPGELVMRRRISATASSYAWTPARSSGARRAISPASLRSRRLRRASSLAREARSASTSARRWTRVSRGIVTRPSRALWLRQTAENRHHVRRLIHPAPPPSSSGSPAGPGGHAIDAVRRRPHDPVVAKVTIRRKKDACAWGRPPPNPRIEQHRDWPRF